MKSKIIAIGIIVFAVLAFAACGEQKVETPSSIQEVESAASDVGNDGIIPTTEQAMDICELATLECYYHNVIKTEKEAESILPWAKGKHYWVEYGGIVKIGIDVSQVDITVDGTQVDITIPQAKVLDILVDESTLSKEYFILAKDSKEIDSTDEKSALTTAKENMEKQAQEDTEQLNRAQERAETLLEDYVNNIGEATGKTYTIKFHTINAESGNTTSASSESEQANSAA